MTSAIFLATILALVVYLTRTKVDQTPEELIVEEKRPHLVHHHHPAPHSAPEIRDEPAADTA